MINIIIDEELMRF